MNNFLSPCCDTEIRFPYVFKMKRFSKPIMLGKYDEIPYGSSSDIPTYIVSVTPDKWAICCSCDKQCSPYLNII